MKQARKWVTLIEGVRELIRLEADGDRIASLITHANWDKYDHREIELFKQARDVLENVTSRLREQLSQAKIRGEGFHEDTGHRGPITDFEWKSRFINFWQSALLNKQHQNRTHYPCITAVEINVDDLLRAHQPSPLGIAHPQRGRKIKFDWPDARKFAFELLSKDGEFQEWDSEWKAQADLERAVRKYIEKHLDPDKGPAESTVRRYVSGWLKEWREGQ